jgi:cold shock protein
MKEVFRERGTVKWFNDGKGYGFIERPGSLTDLFVHFKDIKQNGGERRTLVDGQEVEFEVGQGPKGKVAKNVTKI